MSQRTDRSTRNVLHTDTNVVEIDNEVPVEHSLHRNIPHPLKLKPNPMRKVLIDLFWMEKILIIIDFLQIYGLLWCSAQPWPWPYLWSLYTRWSTVFNIDIFSLSAYSASLGGTSNINLAPWGQYTGYHDYAISFCFSQFISIFVLSRIYYQFDRSYYKNLLLKLYKYKPYIKSFTLFILYIIYLPVNLALFRLYYCESGLLSADPTVLCDDTWHIIIATICSVVTLPFTIGLPIYTHMIVRDSMIYNNSADHEKRCESSNKIHISCFLLLFINSSFGSVNSFGVKSYFTVSFSQFLCMVALNLAGTTRIIIVILISLINQIICRNTIFESQFGCATWPTILTIKRIEKNIPMLRKVLYWIDQLQEANLIRRTFLMSAEHSRDIVGLGNIICSLHKCWLSARKRGSVFQIIIAESLENLIILHSQKKLSSLRNNQGWNEIYEKMTKENNNSENENNNENNDERNNNENNEENNEENKDENKNKNNNLHGNYFKNRYEKYILMNPKKRKILLKLLAVKNLLHDHGKENKYKGTEEPSLEESEERSSEWESRDMFDEYLGTSADEQQLQLLRRNMLDRGNNNWLTGPDLGSDSGSQYESYSQSMSQSMSQSANNSQKDPGSNSKKKSKDPYEHRHEHTNGRTHGRMFERTGIFGESGDEESNIDNLGNNKYEREYNLRNSINTGSESKDSKDNYHNSKDSKDRSKDKNDEHSL